MWVENLKILLKTNFKNDIISRDTNFMYTVNTFRSSSVVEQSAVNRRVVGSNPTCGAILFTFLPVIYKFIINFVIQVCVLIFVRLLKLGAIRQYLGFHAFQHYL